MRMRVLAGFILAALLASGVAVFGIVKPVCILPIAETDPAHKAGNNADDSCIWIHPTDTSLSTVIGNDMAGGLMVWGLDGRNSCGRPKPTGLDRSRRKDDQRLT